MVGAMPDGSALEAGSSLRARIGAFTAAGTFRAAIGWVDHLAAIGVTAIGCPPKAPRPSINGSTSLPNRKALVHRADRCRAPWAASAGASRRTARGISPRHDRPAATPWGNRPALPEPAATEAEKEMWLALRGLPTEHRFRRQHPIGSHVVDFAYPGRKLAIELDGGQHAQQEQEDSARTLEIASLRPG